MIEILLLMIVMILQPIIQLLVEIVKIICAKIIEKIKGLLYFARYTWQKWRCLLFYWGQVIEKQKVLTVGRERKQKSAKEVETRKAKTTPASALARAAGIGYYSPGTK